MPVICQLRLSMHAPCIQQLLHGPGFPNVMPCNRVTLRARHATLRDIRGCCCIIRMHASSGFKQRGTYHVMRPCSPVVTFPRVYHFCYLGHYFPRQIDWIAGSAGPGSAVCQDPKIGTSREIPALYHFCYLGHYFPRHIDWIAGSAGPGSGCLPESEIGTSQEIPVVQNPEIGTFPESENRHIFQNPKIGTFSKFPGFSSAVVRVRRIRCILAVFPPNFENSKTHRRRCPGVIAGYSQLFSRPLFSRPLLSRTLFSRSGGAAGGGSCRAGKLPPPAVHGGARGRARGQRSPVPGGVWLGYPASGTASGGQRRALQYSGEYTSRRRPVPRELCRVHRVGSPGVIDEPWSRARCLERPAVDGPRRRRWARRVAGGREAAGVPPAAQEAVP